MEYPALFALKSCQRRLNLENAVGREKNVQDIDVHGGFEKRVVTLLVMSVFSNFSGASRACADFRDPTAFSRLNEYASGESER